MQKMQSCIIGLDGDFAEQQNCTKSGFKLAYRNIFYVYRNQIQPIPHPAIADAAKVPFADIEAFDRKHFFFPRPEFLIQWLKMPQA
ncbi:MAG: hypothetical protein U1C33_05850, partial [Candidatus Cloacimonadaceae bacterium]|nr:hypothetical protein [Candidatus Cloacimonadaceae bacterium]